MSDDPDHLARLAYKAMSERLAGRHGPTFMLHPWDKQSETLREDWRAVVRILAAEIREP